MDWVVASYARSLRDISTSGAIGKELCKRESLRLHPLFNPRLALGYQRNSDAQVIDEEIPSIWYCAQDGAIGDDYVAALQRQVWFSTVCYFRNIERYREFAAIALLAQERGGRGEHRASCGGKGAKNRHPGCDFERTGFVHPSLHSHFAGSGNDNDVARPDGKGYIALIR